MNTQATDATPSSRAPGPVSFGSIVMAVFGASMIALAAGACWLLLCLGWPRLHAETWLALPLAMLLGPVIRGWVIDAAVPAAVLAALAVLLSAAYMHVLLAASNLAGNFGMGFMQAMRHAGPGMLVQLSWLETTRGAMGVYALAALLAGAMAGRIRPRRRPGA